MILELRFNVDQIKIKFYLEKRCCVYFEKIHVLALSSNYS